MDHIHFVAEAYDQLQRNWC